MNRRAFFDKLAARLNFEPLIPSNWYKIRCKHIIAEPVFIYLLLVLCQKYTCIYDILRAVFNLWNFIKTYGGEH